MRLFDALFRVAGFTPPEYAVPIETDNEFEHVPWDYLAWGSIPMIQVGIPAKVVESAIGVLKFIRPSADDDRMAGFIDRFLSEPVPENLLVFIRYEIHEENLKGVKRYDQMPLWG